VLCRRIRFVFQLQLEAGPDQTIGDEQLVIGALKLRHALEPFHKPILQLNIVLDEIKTVSEAEITPHDAGCGRRFHFALDEMLVLEVTQLLVPLHDRMTFMQRLRDLGITPIRA
jgi:hypothetical protein